ncbi:hypothetical protein DY124_05305 [Apilactobacillus micheneri]|uniref:hypothetical protein n=1 Tax=Apilactobacillus micheneri TaxID=1899430 RepID=UPI001127A935|nr:hypothetical protein [Apilactobacillus micheneri]TPR43574.1 hypothetical protein DY124_05305 [Apilactobacillus micheneri]TPR47524.1 hypothetical protein DY125_05305 [Apilactobacillus micheneri]
MKKTYKIILSSLTIIFILFTYEVPSTSGSGLKNLKKFPIEIKGTWYMYKNYFGENKKQIHKVVINSKEMKFHPYHKHKIINILHQTKNQKKRIP